MIVGEVCRLVRRVVTVMRVSGNWEIKFIIIIIMSWFRFGWQFREVVHLYMLRVRQRYYLNGHCIKYVCHTYSTLLGQDHNDIGHTMKAPHSSQPTDDVMAGQIAVLMITQRGYLFGTPHLRHDLPLSVHSLCPWHSKSDYMLWLRCETESDWLVTTDWRTRTT